MFTLLPPWLLVDLLTDSPMALINPEMLRLLSKDTKQLLDDVFARPMFWQRLMKTCFPGLASRLPHDMNILYGKKRFGVVGSVAADTLVWHSYMRRAITDFRILTVQGSPPTEGYNVLLPIDFYEKLFEPDICCLARDLVHDGMCSLTEYVESHGYEDCRLNPEIQQCYHMPIMAYVGNDLSLQCQVAGTSLVRIEDDYDVILFVNLQKIDVRHYEMWYTPFYVPPFPTEKSELTAVLTNEDGIGSIATLGNVSPNDMIYDVCVRLVFLSTTPIEFPLKIRCNSCMLTLYDTLERPRNGMFRIGDVVGGVIAVFSM